MAIVNPLARGTSGSLLNQVLAERDRLAGNSPSSQPSAPIRQIVQNPILAQESVGSNRILSVKPNLNIEAQSVIPPSSPPDTTALAVSPTPGGVVGPRVGMDEVPPPPGPAAPGGPMWQDPNPKPNNPGPTSAPSSVAAPSGPSTPGRPALGTSIRMPAPSRLTGRIILASLPTKIPTNFNSRQGTWA